MTAQQAAPQAPGLRIGSLRGVPIYIGRTWPIIAIVIVMTFGPQVMAARPDLGVMAFVVAAVFAVLLLVSVLAHEAAHTLVARQFGYHVTRVVADLWGGHTAYESGATRPGASALVAVAGPAANGLLAVAGWLLQPHIPGGVASMLAAAFVWTNAFVAVFNLLPGLPLDGGFLVDSLVWRLTGNRDNGLIAAGWSGRLVTLAVLGWALLWPLAQGRQPTLFDVIWGGLIGAFLWAGATNAIRAGSMRKQLSAISIGSIWRRVGLLPEYAMASEAMGLRTSGEAGAIVVVDPYGTPEGLVEDGALYTMPESQLPLVPVTAVMHRQPPGWIVTAAPQDPVTELVVTMQQLGAKAIAVQSSPGRIDGVVLADDLELALTAPRMRP